MIKLRLFYLFDMIKEVRLPKCYKMSKIFQNIEILISSSQIQKRVSELGKEITDYYRDKVFEKRPLIVIIVQKGASIFGADLVRKIKLPLDLRFMRVVSYRGEVKPQSDPEIFDKIKSGIKNDHVLVIEDVLDTGKTLAFIKNYLTELRPKSLNFAVLLMKKVKREVKVPRVRFKVFNIPNKFVIGYGLDYKEICRNLPYIGILKK